MLAVKGHDCQGMFLNKRCSLPIPEKSINGHDCEGRQLFPYERCSLLDPGEVEEVDVATVWLLGETLEVVLVVVETSEVEAVVVKVVAAGGVMDVVMVDLEVMVAIVVVVMVTAAGEAMVEEDVKEETGGDSCGGDGNSDDFGNYSGNNSQSMGPRMRVASGDA